MQLRKYFISILITAIPASKLFSYDSKQSLQTIMQGFQGLLNQLYAFSAGQNTSIEIVFLSGEATQGRPHNPIESSP